MSNPAAKYTDEFRRETADYIISTGRPITECCAELGLNSKTVNKWVQNRRRELAGGPDPKAEDRELREAKRRMRELEMENAFLKKSRGLLRQKPGVAACYRMMLAEKAEFPVKMMARVLGVSRSGFYSWLSNGCPRENWSAEREAVRRVWLEADRRFGFRFVKCFLPGEFSGLTLYRVRKLMRELGIRGCTPNARKRTTIPDPKARPRPDLVRRDFTSPVPTYKLVGDITYLRTGEGWLYLSTVIDLNTRMVVGWSLSERMTADIVVSALASAKSRGYVAGNAIFHADRGAQYTSRLLAEWARDNDVRLSCSRAGNCHDNAVAESFLATLKNEMYYRRSFPTRDSAKHEVVEFIEAYYNRRRPCLWPLDSSSLRVRNLDTGQKASMPALRRYGAAAPPVGRHGPDFRAYAGAARLKTSTSIRSLRFSRSGSRIRFYSGVRLSAARGEPVSFIDLTRLSTVLLSRSHSSMASRLGFPALWRSTIFLLNSSVKCLGLGPVEAEPPVRLG